MKSLNSKQSMVSSPFPKTIYCFSPSGRLMNLEMAEKGVDFLKQQGFTVLNTTIFLREFERFAGSDLERATEINSLYSQVERYGPMIALATRGGFGLNRIMHLIDWEQLGQAVKNGLRIVGHSDITALQLGLLSATGETSFAGPMLSYDFGGLENDSKDFTYSHFVEAVIHQTFDIQVVSSQDFVTSSVDIKQAVIWGGNLSLVQNLVGTPYFPKNIQQGILFLEDINEHPYRIERMLWQLLDAGILGSQQAILLGDFSEYRLTDLDQGYSLKTVVGQIQKELQRRGCNTLMLMDLPFGHIPKKITIEVGSEVNLQADANGYRISKSS
ncbi:LD-carboxypeptidase [Polynucleobacter kasalickyi]|uniref:Muramoyltetrapeptide carboxypeptidase n=1 Tax=Polynucleobacter kasalickyi TaxID=1938817 RepID=A0A1W2BG60_9BURK|nr:LD-carboxypeptidase [Polynucleobacter kasalickyi]SMC71831.1 muramoyltetrapeptide carboxypeptidase [Polynucleobacter kasalickyi]